MLNHKGTLTIKTARLILRQADRNNQGICDASFYGLLAQER